MQPRLNVLFLSYDGLTDPLGQSQVLPYLKGLAKIRFRFTIISFEKSERYLKLGSKIEKECEESGIRWIPKQYTKDPPILSTFKDLCLMFREMKKAHLTDTFQLLHCRSYLTTLLALLFKSKFGVPFIFDMRGFWADERREGQIWNLNNPIYYSIYRFFKRKEIAFIQEAAAVVSLTHAGKEEIGTWFNSKSGTSRIATNDSSIGKSVDLSKIFVIPCAADLELFRLSDAEERSSARIKLGLENHTVLTYLGSLGTWYMLHEMLDCYRVLNRYSENLLFQFITPEPPELIYEAALKIGVHKDNLRIHFAERNELRTYLAATDIGINFMRPGISRKATSPVKFGEMQCMGIPMIVNIEIGDIAEQIKSFNGGMVLDEFNELNYHKAGANFQLILELDRTNISIKATETFSLTKAIEDYASIYNHIMN